MEEENWREILEKCMKVIEWYEEAIDGEWGSCRKWEEILNDDKERWSKSGGVKLYKEIVDHLNQKQPEGVWHEADGVLHDYETGESILYSQLKPEKQEEWRGELLNLPFVKEYLSQKVVANKKEEQGYAEILNMVKDREVEELLNKIDQLLSKRTFSKEELRILSTSTEWVDYIALQEECKDITDLEEKHKKVCKKVFKLLKEKE